MRQSIAAGNWKMNLSLEEARQLVTNIKTSKIPKDVTVLLGAPTPYLYVLNSLVQDKKNIHIVAQNCYSKPNGAYTGEVSINMLESIDVHHVIIGHSERRQIFKESSKLLKDKVDILIENGFKVIFCCGEPLKTRKEKKQNQYVLDQLKKSVFHLSSEDFQNVIIAYEPIWAIGTGETASPAQAQSMHKYIRQQIAEKYNRKLANETSILYGGSVKPTNAKELFGQKDVDGGLVGGASLKADSFSKIINAF